MNQTKYQDKLCNIIIKHRINKFIELGFIKPENKETCVVRAINDRIKKIAHVMYTISLTDYYLPSVKQLQLVISFWSSNTTSVYSSDNIDPTHITYVSDKIESSEDSNNIKLEQADKIFEYIIIYRMYDILVASGGSDGEKLSKKTADMKKLTEQFNSHNNLLMTFRFVLDISVLHMNNIVLQSNTLQLKYMNHEEALKFMYHKLGYDTYEKTLNAIQKKTMDILEYKSLIVLSSDPYLLIYGIPTSSYVYMYNNNGSTISSKILHVI